MTKLNIPRLLGESQEDFRRRYTREKMRIYRAARPKQPRKPRKAPSGPHRDAQYTQEQWEGLRQQDGEDDSEWKRRAGKERQRIHRAKPENREKELGRRREIYAQNPEAARARQRAWREANPEAVTASQRKYIEANRADLLAKLIQWRKDNPERLKAAVERWNAAHRGLLNHYSAAWRKQARIATPAWADMDAILAIYEESRRISVETGVEHHVDHYYPLRGKTVCGLHVEDNLRVIPGAENMRKHNSHPDLDGNP